MQAHGREGKPPRRLTDVPKVPGRRGRHASRACDCREFIAATSSCELHVSRPVISARGCTTSTRGGSEAKLPEGLRRGAGEGGTSCSPCQPPHTSRRCFSCIERCFTEIAFSGEQVESPDRTLRDALRFIRR
ncbi:hypothetical protein V5799_010082 [Amblyomma americanum]|uniref:Uncharacterized protein n=1 Tax=Amblyomma americanum TaxID=6943 RepID=A0AAQ4FA04_AMBAM